MKSAQNTLITKSPENCWYRSDFFTVNLNILSTDFINDNDIEQINTSLVSKIEILCHSTLFLLFRIQNGVACSIPIYRDDYTLQGNNFKGDIEEEKDIFQDQKTKLVLAISIWIKK